MYCSSSSVAMQPTQQMMTLALRKTGRVDARDWHEMLSAKSGSFLASLLAQEPGIKCQSTPLSALRFFGALRTAHLHLVPLRARGHASPSSSTFLELVPYKRGGVHLAARSTCRSGNLLHIFSRPLLGFKAHTALDLGIRGTNGRALVAILRSCGFSMAS